MRNLKYVLYLVILLVMFTMLTGANGGCGGGTVNQERADAVKVNSQQGQYAKVHPIPFFDHSRERAVYTQIYQARNKTVATHTIWRSNTGMIEGDCPSIGFPIPYDVQLTNPLKGTSTYRNPSIVEQAEPNGMFSSKTTAATWVMCAVKDQGVMKMAPVYIESKVTAYPFPMIINYKNDTARQAEGAKSTVLITEGK